MIRQQYGCDNGDDHMSWLLAVSRSVTRTVLAASAALILLAGEVVALAQTEVMVISEFTIEEHASFSTEGNLDLDPAAALPSAEGWFETNILWLYLDTNHPVTLTVVGEPYRMGREEGTVTLPTQLRGAHGPRNAAVLHPFGWLTLRGQVSFREDIPGRYVAWLQLRVSRDGYADHTGNYTAIVTVTVSY